MFVPGKSFIVGKVRGHLKFERVHFKLLHLGRLPPMSQKDYPKELARDKQSSLFFHSYSYEEKSLIIIYTSSLDYNTFHGRK